MSERQKLPPVRCGKTHKIPCGPVTMYVTINVDEDGVPREMFIKADEGHQGFCDVLAETASLAMQRGCPLNEILRHWRFHRFGPSGPGQGASLPDAIARKLGKEKGVAE